MIKKPVAVVQESTSLKATKQDVRQLLDSHYILRFLSATASFFDLLFDSLNRIIVLFNLNAARSRVAEASRAICAASSKDFLVFWTVAQRETAIISLI